MRESEEKGAGGGGKVDEGNGQVQGKEQPEKFRGRFKSRQINRIRKRDQSVNHPEMSVRDPRDDQDCWRCNSRPGGQPDDEDWY